MEKSNVLHRVKVRVERVRRVASGFMVVGATDLHQEISVIGVKEEYIRPIVDRLEAHITHPHLKYGHTYHLQFNDAELINRDGTSFFANQSSSVDLFIDGATHKVEPPKKAQSAFRRLLSRLGADSEEGNLDDQEGSAPAP